MMTIRYGRRSAAPGRIDRLPSGRARAGAKTDSAEPGTAGAGTPPARRTDEEFVRALREKFGRQLFAFVVRLTGDMHWAEDIVQVTLIRAWRSRDKIINDGETACGWLFIVARRVFIDECRARARRPVRLTGDDIGERWEADEEVDRLVSSFAITQALASLSAVQRQAIVECFYWGRSVAEAAEVLGVPPGTVKSRVCYGLRALRKVMEERGDTRDLLAAA
jgi:RNA polymerase sigma-70 factor (ECF subfamily)